MKSYTQFGIYDFTDFAEELDENELLFVNGGGNYGCGGGYTGDSYKPSPSIPSPSPSIPNIPTTPVSPDTYA